LFFNFKWSSRNIIFLELEQEIETFKKENAKISLLKKKLGEEKQKITKEWEEFEKVTVQGGRSRRSLWSRRSFEKVPVTC
jgi:hypothetical protein